MQVNHNCKILFKLGTGINSAGYVLPQSGTCCAGCTSAAPEHAVLWLLPAWVRDFGGFSFGEEWIKAWFSSDNQVAGLRARALMCVATVPSCASERWWTMQDSRGLSTAPGCQRRKETEHKILFWRWPFAAVFGPAIYLLMWCNANNRDSPWAFTA